jgi:hypothetical protein
VLTRTRLICHLRHARHDLGRYFESEVDSIYNALEYEFVEAMKHANRTMFKATKAVNETDAAATKALWKCAMSTSANSEKEAFFEANRLVMRSTRPLAVISGPGDRITTIRFDSANDASRKVGS